MPNTQQAPARARRSRPRPNHGVELLEGRRLLAVTTFTVDPNLTQLVATTEIRNQAGSNATVSDISYNNPARFSGTIKAELGTGEIAFLGDSQLTAANGPTFVTPGNSPANYKFSAQLGRAIELAYRNLTLTLTGSALRFGNSFIEEDITSRFTAGRIDYTVGEVARDRSVVDRSSRVGTGTGTVSVNGSTTTLTIPVNAVYEFILETGVAGVGRLNQAFRLQGTIVANSTEVIANPGIVSGHVYNDVNDDGVHQSGEEGLGGRIVYLDANNNRRPDDGEQRTLTDASGAYTFSQAKPGNYKLRVIPPTGWRTTSPAEGTYEVTVVSGQTIADRDFLLTKRARISGRVYQDANGNGRLDSGEQRLADVTVYVDANGNGALDDEERTTVTNAAGEYLFNRLAPGNHRVRIVTPAGFRVLTPTGGTQNVSVSVGQILRNRDFGLTTESRIAGRVFFDRNRDGRRNSGEAGIVDAIVYIDANENGKLDREERRVRTGRGGEWVMEGLAEGTYQVRAIVASELAFTRPSDGLRTVTVTPAATIGELTFGAAPIVRERERD